MHPFYDSIYYALKTKNINIKIKDDHSRKILNELIHILHNTKLCLPLNDPKYSLGFDFELGIKHLFIYDDSIYTNTDFSTETILSINSIENYIEHYTLFNTNLYDYLCQIGGRTGYSKGRIL